MEQLTIADAQSLIEKGMSIHKERVDTINRDLDTLQKQLEKAEETIKNNGSVDPTLITQIKNFMEQSQERHEKLAKQQDATELMLKGGRFTGLNQKSAEQRFIEELSKDTDYIQQLRIKSLNSKSFNLGFGQEFIQSKSVANVTLGNVTGVLPAEYNNTIVHAPEREMHMRNIIRQSPLTGATYSYPVYTLKEGAAGIQTEGSAKATADFNIVFKNEVPVVIAVTETLSEQILDDIPGLLSFISNRMIELLLLKEDDEILNGAGGSNRLNGIITQATAFVPTGTANTANADRFAYLFSAISQLLQLNRKINGIVLNPYGYFELLQVKTTQKEYTSPYAAVTWINNTLRLAGIPIYMTTALGANNFLVGDWNQAELKMKNDINVAISNEHGTNFTQNLVTIRVEERLGLAVYQPASFVYGSWTALSS